jgi:hypothetical protein
LVPPASMPITQVMPGFHDRRQPERTPEGQGRNGGTDEASNRRREAAS